MLEYLHVKFIRSSVLGRMPVMLTKVEGRGNGIKTVIPNMSDVAKALSRPPQCESIFKRDDELD